ncbi:GT2 family glycosyltransferase [Lachnotalea glycerini]|uniref:GT2 family glycosyltransferase n=1 Tax=Lachnotalea glycerini TaxID=1763509 RepID=A0A318EPX7_9FIRM|nr:glycosyltransferase [Lachnotalea glycerini]PXV91456.1 GT2 family glycosyltransferase [Lachnotalea glycerini]
MLDNADELFTGERFVPGVEDKKLEIEHFQRYQSIKELVRGKKVLDAACGEGYGSNILALAAQSVVGVDIDSGAVKRASVKYKNQANLKYMERSIADLEGIEDQSIEVVVSFETIEHVPEEVQMQFREEIARVLTKDGILIMSTPNKEIYSDLYDYHNEFHIKEFYKQEFIDFLQDKFSNVKLYNQYFEVTSIIDSNLSEEGEVQYYKDRKQYDHEGKYFIAIASNAQLPQQSISSVFMNAKKEHEESIHRIIELQEDVEKRNSHLMKLDELIDSQSTTIYELQEEIEKRGNHILNLDRQLEKSKKQVEELEQIRLEYEHKKTTISWKLMYKIQRIGDFLLPPQSKRRFFARVSFNLVKDPKMIIKMLSFKRIKNYFKYIKKEGLDGVSKRYEEAFEIEKSYASPEKNINIDTNKIKPKNSIQEYEKIDFYHFDSPEVSIIIPVYNQFEYTHNCLKSIKENSGDVAYEIIIGNDCSTDFTTQIEEVVSGINVITNKENLRFLMNCNHAAKYAKGKYILFLNNDTQVQSDWLRPLIELMERDENIGLTGSKLIYADGRLQEAGGIVWKDGSAWNYGNYQNPDASEYNYVKDVDYISGASIMIRTKLWNEIEGFDELFAPAYCEDSDLAFTVRKKGFRVVYQPRSVVVHFEGISNGVDVSSGIKKYQIKNTNKLFLKWENEIKNQYENAENVFCARERNFDKKVILFIDHYVPTFDKDAGSKTIYQYLKMFLKKGYSVKFIGDNFYQAEPYTTILQQMGIEVLYGNYYAKNVFKWIKENQQQIDFVFLNRPHIAMKYIDFLHNETHLKVIYYGHDLHFLRNMREYELTGDLKKKKEAEEWKKKELYLMNHAQMSYYPSCIEEEKIHEIDSDIKVKAITAYVFDEFKRIIQDDFSKRDGIVFIGGFTHDPNQDAVNWFVEKIWPKIYEVLQIPFYIVGSNAPLAITNLNGINGIIVKGYVTEEELTQLYQKCKISIVPLRYGAGVKGKVIEAIYHGIPVVTTSVGAEGIKNSQDVLEIRNSEEDFAKCVIKLYQDNKELTNIAHHMQEFIKEYFSIDAVWKIIEEDFI